jgi:hypothetical protein
MNDEREAERLMTLAFGTNWVDRSVIEAASWRLASELMRRHPDGSRLTRSYFSTGQNDVLWIRTETDPGVDLRLNRDGTIQVLGRLDRRPIEWEPTTWIEYLAADPREFLERLEAAAGWPAPSQVPASTPETLTYRILAALAATATKTIDPILIGQGYIDSDYGGPNSHLERFRPPEELTRRRNGDLMDEPGYRFWIPVRGEEPLMAIEQSTATAWFLGSTEPTDLRAGYQASGKEPAVVAAELLKRSVTGATGS